MLLTIHFPAPGFFIADMPVEVRVDGDVVHRGPFTRGFRVEVDVDPGSHTLTTAIGVGVLQRKRSYLVEVPADGETLVCTLVYSRTWGNFDEKLVTSDVPIAADVAAPEADEGPEPPSVPVRATWMVLAVLVAVFGLEYALAVSPRDGLAPSVATLEAMGGLGPTAVKDGELYRMLTCTLLHADPVHLGLNALSLVLGGLLVERKTGPYWFFVLYTASAIGGSIMSLLLNKGFVSIGASGAILGVFGAGMVIASAYPHHQRAALRLQLARVLVPSLLPIVEVHGDKVDFGAHLGGAIVGLGMGFALLRPLKQSALPGGSPFASRGLGKLLAVAGVVATLGAAGLVAARSYPVARANAATMATLIPDDAFPIKGPPTEAQYAEWKTKYPDDPRTIFHVGAKALDARDKAGFERALVDGRAAIARTAKAIPKESTEAFTKDFDALESDRDLLELVSTAETPQGTEDALAAAWDAKVPELLAKYPNDPRVRMNAAFAAFDRRDYEGALTQLRLARQVAPRVEKFFPKGLDLRSLAGLELLALTNLGRTAEAAAVHTRVCGGLEGESAKAMAESVCKAKR